MGRRIAHRRLPTHPILLRSTTPATLLENTRRSIHTNHTPPQCPEVPPMSEGRRVHPHPPLADPPAACPPARQEFHSPPPTLPGALPGPRVPNDHQVHPCLPPADAPLPRWLGAPFVLPSCAAGRLPQWCYSMGIRALNDGRGATLARIVHPGSTYSDAYGRWPSCSSRKGRCNSGGASLLHLRPHAIGQFHLQIHLPPTPNTQ